MPQRSGRPAAFVEQGKNRLVIPAVAVRTEEPPIDDKSDTMPVVVKDQMTWTAVSALVPHIRNDVSQIYDDDQPVERKIELEYKAATEVARR